MAAINNDGLLLERVHHHPRDSRIEFVEKTHQYILDGRYIFPRSVSGFVSKFFSHFDSKGIIRKNLLKWKTNPDEKTKRYQILFNVFSECFPNSNENDECEFLCRLWKTNGERQSSLGTALHKSIELYLNGIPSSPSSGDGGSGDHKSILKDEENNTHCCKEEVEPPCDFNFFSLFVKEEVENFKKLYSVLVDKTLFSLWPQDAKSLILSCSSKGQGHGGSDDSSSFTESEEMKSWFKWWETEKDDLIPYRTEWSVFSEVHDLAGQIDAVFQRKSKNNAFVLVDWKRVSNMDYGGDGNNNNNSFLPQKIGKPPFQSLPDTNYGHYILQVNLYEMILERFYGIKIEERFLVQIHPSLPEPGYKVHPIKKI